MAGNTQKAKTLYDKLWDDHLVKQRDDGSALLYIDRHLLHEVTSPQAFEGLQLAGRKPWRLSANVATPDHNVPTSKAERDQGIAGIEDATSRIQVQTLDDNCEAFNIVEFTFYSRFFAFENDCIFFCWNFFCHNSFCCCFFNCIFNCFFC